MHKQAEGSISRGYKGNICTKCLVSNTGTIGQYMHKSTSSNNTGAMGSVSGAKTGCSR